MTDSEQKTKFKVRINYKSGHSVDFWVYKFTCNRDGSIEWTSIDPRFRPVDMGVEHIESIWQVDAIIPEDEDFEGND